MRDNERVMNARMQKMHEERLQMEKKLSESAIVIQRHARGMIARIAYNKRVEEIRVAEK